MLLGLQTQTVVRSTFNVYIVVKFTFNVYTVAILILYCYHQLLPPISPPIRYHTTPETQFLENF